MVAEIQRHRHARRGIVVFRVPVCTVHCGFDRHVMGFVEPFVHAYRVEVYVDIALERNFAFRAQNVEHILREHALRGDYNRFFGFDGFIFVARRRNFYDFVAGNFLCGEQAVLVNLGEFSALGNCPGNACILGARDNGAEL